MRRLRMELWFYLSTLALGRALNLAAKADDVQAIREIHAVTVASFKTRLGSMTTERLTKR